MPVQKGNDMRRDAYRWAVVALAALALAGCSTESDPPPSTVTVTAGSTSAAAATENPGAPSTVTVTHTPPPTVTVTSPGAAPGGKPGNVEPISGPFRSPSGNIRCNAFNFDGPYTVRCEVVEKKWTAPPREPACQLDWGNRLEVTEGNNGLFSCYGQNMPDPQQTLGYGKMALFGSITCTSDEVGIMCLDNDTGHYFRLSRDDYGVG